MPFELYLHFWGKANDHSQHGKAFHPVVCHGLDVAAVVGAMLDARPLALARIAAVIGIDESECRRLLIALAALHDIGKFAPAFQSKVPELWPTAVLGTFEPSAITKTHHTDDGFRLWYDKLHTQFEGTLWPGAAYALDAIAPAIFGHHGRPVSPLAARSLSARQVFGDSALAIALSCANDVLGMLGRTPIDGPPPSETNARLASWLIAGLMTTADWIGSRQRWFPYQAIEGGLDLAAYWTRAKENAREAIAREGLAAPLSSRDRSFVQVTGIAEEPTPAQCWASDVALLESQTLIILEDVTGAGKTEAAQMLVHRLMAKGLANGAYWAMPTQATANAMYARQCGTLSTLFETPESTHRKPSLVLAHGQSALDSRFRATVVEVPAVDAEREGVHDDFDAPSSVLCAEFFANDGRAALLADIGAGTIDQALLGVLPSRFNAMRLLGLHDKVLVIDEAHAYDAYMSAELEALLRFQSAFGGSAIVLSATLPQRKRAELVKAWTTGGRRTRLQRGAAAAAPSDDGYPLATIVGRNSDGETDLREYALQSASWSKRDVPVRFVSSASDVESEVVSAASTGAAVVWIRNTVRDCLAAAESLSALGIEAMVFHARFAHCDRQSRERQVLGIYGKAGAPNNRARVLVATQVVEQSLDLDFDVMFTDVAPVDLLIQRAGRLWRHGFRDAARPAGINRELVVLAPQLVDEPDAGWLKSMLPGTNAVYRNTGVLWRTVRVLEEAGAIVTPDGLRDLIEGVYGGDEYVPEALQAATDAAMVQEQSNRAVARFAVLNLTDGYSGGAVAWESDLRAVTRLSESQTTLRLTVDGADGTLGPWAGAVDGPPWKAWALSEVRVASRRVPFDVRAASEYAAKIEAARAGWRRFDEGIPIVPLTRRDADEWGGTLIKADKSTIHVRYSRSRGLDLE